MVAQERAQIDFPLFGCHEMDQLAAIQHRVKELVVGELFVNEECHHEAQDIGQQLHAFVICELERLINVYEDVREAAPHIVIMHQLQEVTFLFNLDRY